MEKLLMAVAAIFKFEGHTRKCVLSHCKLQTRLTLCSAFIQYGTAVSSPRTSES